MIYEYKTQDIASCKTLWPSQVNEPHLPTYKGGTGLHGYQKQNQS